MSGMASVPVQKSSSKKEDYSIANPKVTLQLKSPIDTSDPLEPLPTDLENDHLSKLPMEMKVAILAAMPDLETLRTVSSHLLKSSILLR